MFLVVCTLVLHPYASSRDFVFAKPVCSQQFLLWAAAWCQWEFLCAALTTWCRSSLSMILGIHWLFWSIPVNQTPMFRVPGLEAICPIPWLDHLFRCVHLVPWMRPWESVCQSPSRRATQWSIYPANGRCLINIAETNDWMDRDSSNN